MPAINFQEQFVRKIIEGEKHQTIRQVRKRPIKVGDPLFLYAGMRTKQCRLIMRTTCAGIYKIQIRRSQLFEGVVRRDSVLGPYTIDLPAGLRHFAKEDGFESWPEMLRWFEKRYGLPFEGVIIEW